MVKNKVAILLAGSGYLDGTEINEAVLTFLALSKYNINYQCYSLDKDQHHTIDHITQEENTKSKRNILKESSRMARGDVKEISLLDVDSYSSIIIPGGFGVAKNFCNYAIKGKDFTINSQIEKILLNFYKQKKYIGAICISPIILAKLFLDKKPILTLGSKDNCQNNFADFNTKYEVKTSSQICVDVQNKFISTPAFMNKDSLYNVSIGIEELVKYIKNHI